MIVAILVANSSSFHIQGSDNIWRRYEDVFFSGNSSVVFSSTATDCDNMIRIARLKSDCAEKNRP